MRIRAQEEDEEDDSSEAELIQDFTADIKILEDMLAVLFSFLEDIKDKKFDQEELENIARALYAMTHSAAATFLEEALMKASRS